MAFLVAALRRSKMYSTDDLTKKIDNDLSMSCLSLTELDDGEEKGDKAMRPVSCIYGEYMVAKMNKEFNKRNKRPLSSASQLSWWNGSYEVLNLNQDSDDIIVNKPEDCLNRSYDSFIIYHRYDSIQDKSLQLMRKRHRKNKKRFRHGSEDRLSEMSLIVNEQPIAVEPASECTESDNLYEPVQWSPAERIDRSRHVNFNESTDNRRSVNFENIDEPRCSLTDNQESTDNRFSVYSDVFDDSRCYSEENLESTDHRRSVHFDIFDDTRCSSEEKENIDCNGDNYRTANVNRHNSIQLKSWQIRRQRRAIQNMRRKTVRYGGSFAPHQLERVH